MKFLAKGLIGGLTMAAAFIGFARALYLIYRGIRALRPKEVRQEQRRLLSHRFYPVCWRGRAAYLLLCLEEALIFYRQDLDAWEWIFQKLWYPICKDRIPGTRESGTARVRRSDFREFTSRKSIK